MLKTLKKEVSRRSFLKITAATVGAAVVAGSSDQLLVAADEANVENDVEVKVIHSTCRACGKMECANLITVQNGRVVNLQGDDTGYASRGNLCVKGRAAMQALYHPDRVRYAAKRTNPKGEDPGWVRVSHDEGIQAMAAGFNAAINKYGPHTLKCTHGTGRITTYATEAYPTFCVQTANTGSPAGILCKGPRLASAAMICYPGAHWCNLVDGQRVFIQWGCNQEVSNYDNGCRTTVDEQVRAETTICVGPRLQNLGKEADIWLDLRPGTDDALALGMLRECVVGMPEKGMSSYDETFVKKWTNAPFLYSKEIEPSGWTWSEWGSPDGKMEMGSYPVHIKTRLVKESDLIEGGSPRKFAVWNHEANDGAGGITFFDSEKCFWDGETDYTYPSEDQWVWHQGTTDKLKGLAGGILVPPGNDKMPAGIDPALDGVYELELKSGKKITAKPVWEFFKEFLDPWTPEYTEEITWVAADKILEATHAFCKEPCTGGIMYNLPTEHAANSIQTTQLPLILSALMGGVDSPGGQRGVENMMYLQDTLLQYHIPWINNRLDPKEQIKVCGGDRFPLTPFMQMVGGAALFHDPISASEYMEGVDFNGDPTPYQIHCMISESGQHFNSGNAMQNWEAFKKLDFYGCWELWHSPTSELADVLMPAAHFLEVSVARYTQGAEAAIGAQVQAVPRQGDATWDSADVCCELSKAMGYMYWPPSEVTEELSHYWPAEGNDKEGTAAEPGYNPARDGLHPADYDPFPVWPKAWKTDENGNPDAWPTEQNMLDMSVFMLSSDLCEPAPLEMSYDPKSNGSQRTEFARVDEYGAPLMHPVFHYPNPEPRLHLETDPGNNGETIGIGGWDDYVRQYQEHGQWSLKEISPMGYYQRYMWGHFRPRPQGDTTAPFVPGWNTPTGKFEILGTILESYHKRIPWFPTEEQGTTTVMKFPPELQHLSEETKNKLNDDIARGEPIMFPDFREPPESPYSDPQAVADGFNLIITTGRRNPLYFHNEGRQQPWLREQTPAPNFQIHPDTAASLGIKQGDWCWIETRRGKIRECADLFYGIRPGTIECDHQWWFPELSAPKHGFDLSNVNVLVNRAHYSQDQICGTSNIRAYLGKAYRATPENSPFGNPVPCDDDGTEIITRADDPRLKAWLPDYQYVDGDDAQ
jgi:anaerobic selenocysteine-containing dehydrogenase